MPKVVKSSTNRRLDFIRSLGLSTLAMRPCQGCVNAQRPCRVASGSSKCIECIRSARTCDLAAFDSQRYKRLDRKRKELKRQLLEQIAKQQRLLKEIDHIEDIQQGMVNQEIENIDELEREEQAEVSGLPDALIDVSSEQVVFSDGFDDLLWTSLAPDGGTLAGVSGNSQGS